MTRFVSFTTGVDAASLRGDGLRTHLLDQLHRILVDILGYERIEKALDGLFRGESLVQGLLDRDGGGDLEDGRSAGAEAQGSLGLHVRGITGRHQQVPIGLIEGEDVVLARHRLGHEQDGIRITSRAVHDVETEVLGDQAAES